MKAYPVCVPCLINQGLNAVKRLNLGKEKEKEIAIRALKYLSEFDTLDRSPAYYAYFVQRIVKEIAGTDDPFKEQKKIANRKALEVLPWIEKMLNDAEDKLAFSLKVSAVGNCIDFAIRGDFDLEKDVKKLIESNFLVWHYEEFRENLEKARSVLIIGDNAGEIVFDKVLVRTLKDIGKDVFYCVKGKPILNDATYEDAQESSMTEMCRVIDNGSDKVGTWLEDCSQEFLDIFWKADIVISKGQANFETLSNVKRDIFFLLVAKCEPIAQETGGAVGKFVLMYRSPDKYQE